MPPYPLISRDNLTQTASGGFAPVQKIAGFVSQTLSIPAAVNHGSTNSFVSGSQFLSAYLLNCVGLGSTLVSGSFDVDEIDTLSLVSAAGIVFKSPPIVLQIDAGFKKHRFFGIIDFGIVTITLTRSLAIPSYYQGCYPSYSVIYGSTIYTNQQVVTRINFDAILTGTINLFYNGENVGSIPFAANNGTVNTVPNAVLVADNKNTFNSHNGLSVSLPQDSGLTLAEFDFRGLIDRAEINFNIAYGQYSGPGVAFFAVQSNN